MDKEKVQKALAELKELPKKKFSQSYDLIINLKNFEIKKNPLDLFVSMHHTKGKKVKVAAFVGQQLEDQANKHCDLTITEPEFAKFKEDKKAVKKLAQEYDIFIAQANLMPKVAAAFGRVLGARGKMPNPKLGCVVPPNANLEPLIQKLQKSVRLVAKKGMNLQCIIGKESQPDKEVIDNIITIVKTVTKQLPNEDQNIKNVQLKLTMSKPVKL